MIAVTIEEQRDVEADDGEDRGGRDRGAEDGPPRRPAGERAGGQRHARQRAPPRPAAARPRPPRRWAAVSGTRRLPVRALLLPFVAARRHVSAHQIRTSRLMTARAAMLTTSVTANRTRPAAISALTSRPDDSGKSSAMFAAIVDGFAGADQVERDVAGDGQHDRHGHRLAERAAEPEHRRADHGRACRTAGRSSGSSPSASRRARARPPAGAAASASNTERVTAVMIGRIITASTRPATSIVRPVAEAGPLKNGIQPTWSASHSWMLDGGGAEDGDAPEAVDDARDRGQQIDDVARAAARAAAARSG